MGDLVMQAIMEGLQPRTALSPLSSNSSPRMGPRRASKASVVVPFKVAEKRVESSHSRSDYLSEQQTREQMAKLHGMDPPISLLLDQATIAAIKATAVPGNTIQQKRTETYCAPCY